MSHTENHDAAAFTLLELLVVIAIIGVVCAMLLPALARTRDAGRSAVCCNNLRQMETALNLYLSDHDGRFFPWIDTAASTSPGQTLYYFGLSSDEGAEGSRAIDKSQAKLAPYFAQTGGIETCPAFPYNSPYFKQKYDCATYGYGMNGYLLPGAPVPNASNSISCFSMITRPSETVVWGDAIQIDTWLAPASSSHPMLEEWYWLDNGSPPKFHFRHNGHCNVVMADGSVRSLSPSRLDSRCDGLCGYVDDSYLCPVK